MSSSNCPFEEDGRIDHKLFGSETVAGAPVAVVGPDARSTGGLRDAGWPIPVKWDNLTRTAGAVMNQALHKVSSPDSWHFGHWDRQWQPLLQPGWPLYETLNRFPQVSGPCPSFTL